MGFLIAWLTVVFIGFCYELLSIGAAVNDYSWFKRLDFRQAVQTVARTHMVVEAAFTGIMFVFIVIGVVAYINTPTPAPPVTLPRVVTSLLFIAVGATIPGISIWMRLQRREQQESEETRQMEELGAAMNGGPDEKGVGHG